MKIYYGLEKIRKFKNTIVVLGVFDGVHLAHRRILKEAVRKARAIKQRSILVTFWPHPQKEESLYSLEHRLKLISEFGIDECIVIKFNHKFSKMLPNDFVEKILLGKIGVKYIYVGKNFTFGRGGKGNFKLLKSLSGVHHFKLKIFDVIKINHLPVSSTYIRRLIKRGDLKRAQNLLVRPVSILGTVIKGASVARRLGFPTANIDPHHEVLPPPGVYAVSIIYEKKKFFGVCSIGHKPTFNKKDKIQHIEVNIFNFDKNIYGAYLEIQFIKLLRKQEKFASPVVLAAQIKNDIISAKKMISHH
ncbi:MAG: riboflavin biosynthesis protein RibF [Candidatus Omnitrophota bacterium]